MPDRCKSATTPYAGGHTYVCDRERGHAGEHRAYWDEHDAVLFWPYARTHNIGCCCGDCHAARIRDARDPRDLNSDERAR